MTIVIDRPLAPAAAPIVDVLAIEVTQEDIDGASPEDCPLKRAGRRTLHTDAFLVGLSSALIHGRSYLHDAAEFTRAFDAGYAVSPRRVTFRR